MYAHTANTQRFARTTASPRATGRYVRARAEKDIGQEIKETLKENVSQSAASETTAMKEDATNVTHPATPGSAVGDSLKPRVEELRQDQIGKGTTDPGRALLLLCCAQFEVVCGPLFRAPFPAAIVRRPWCPPALLCRVPSRLPSVAHASCSGPYVRMHICCWHMLPPPLLAVLWASSQSTCRSETKLSRTGTAL